MDQVFGGILPKKKRCSCAHCQTQLAAQGMSGLPAEPFVDPGVDFIPEPAEPGIADPLAKPPAASTESIQGFDANRAKATSRPRVPLKVTDPKREFPTSTDPSHDPLKDIQLKQPAVELRPLDKAPPSSTNKNNREPGVHIPEWLDDPFKEEQSRKESGKPERMMSPTPVAPGEIRWTKRPVLEQQSQKVPKEPSDRVVESEPPNNPVIKLKIGDSSREQSIAERFSDRQDTGVVKASADQPIRIRFPATKQ